MQHYYEHCQQNLSKSIFLRHENKKCYKSLQVKIIINNGLTQDDESNQNQRQVTCLKRIFIVLK